MNSTSTKNNTFQPLHSDGNFKPSPPNVIALQCIRPSSKGGGFTKLVRAEELHGHIARIAPKTLPDLYQEEAIAFFRKDRNSKVLRIIEYHKPIFCRMETGRIGISFNPMMSKIVSTPRIERLYRLIMYFVSKPKNQITFQLGKNETLIADNFSLLHARTAFPVDGERLLRRGWFDTNSPDIHLGFTV